MARTGIRWQPLRSAHRQDPRQVGMIHDATAREAARDHGDPGDGGYARRDRGGAGLGGRRERRDGRRPGAAAQRPRRRGLRDSEHRGAAGRSRLSAMPDTRRAQDPKVAPRFEGDPGDSLLLTDLYQLNMLQAYRDAGMTATAVFEFFVRKLPPVRGFLVAAGLEQVLEFLETARFDEAELEWLDASGRFSSALLDDLAKWRFTGDVHAMPEGTVF